MWIGWTPWPCWSRCLTTGSLAAAGRHLRRSPPVITRTIATLEQQVGVRLVERTTRRLAPTDAGLALGARARVSARRLCRRDTGARAGGVAGYGADHGAGGVRPAARHSVCAGVPELSIRMCGSRWSSRIATWIWLRRGLDLAVRIGPLVDSALVARRVGDGAAVAGCEPRLSGGTRVRRLYPPIWLGMRRSFRSHGVGCWSGGSATDRTIGSFGWLPGCSSTTSRRCCGRRWRDMASLGHWSYQVVEELQAGHAGAAAGRFRTAAGAGAAGAAGRRPDPTGSPCIRCVCNGLSGRPRGGPGISCSGVQSFRQI